MVTRACGELKMDRKDFRFTRRRIREKTGLSYEQVRVHLDRLVDYEYVLTHRGGRGQSFVYELIYDGKGRDGKPFLMNLLDTEKLKPSEELKVPEMAQMAAKYDAKFVG
jgi:predicted ArsR family transcriptional regulator